MKQATMQVRIPMMGVADSLNVAMATTLLLYEVLRQRQQGLARLAVMTSPFSIVFEDNHLFVLNKPAGLLTQPSGTEQDSLEQQAKAWLKEAYQKPGNVFLEAVHRLDKPVSGLVVFGKTSKALSRLNTAIRAKQTKKFYYAWVDRPPPSLAGMLENFLIHDDFHAQVVSSSHPQGKLARLSYRLVESRGAGALLEIDLLETGRYHQIRVQLATIRLPPFEAIIVMAANRPLSPMPLPCITDVCKFLIRSRKSFAHLKLFYPLLLSFLSTS